MNRWYILLITVIALMTACSSPNDPKTLPDASIQVFQRTIPSTSVQVQELISAKKISFTESLHLQLVVTHPDTESIEPLYFTEQHFAPFKISSRPVESSKLLNNGQKEVRISYQLEPFTTGKLTIQGLGIQLSGQNKKLMTNPVEINVFLPEKLKSGDLKPIRPEISPPMNWIPLILWLVGLSSAGLFWFWWKQREMPQEVKPDIQISYVDWANDALKILDEKQLLEHGKLKEYYTEVSYILRHFLEKHLNLPAEEQTTEEFLEEMTSSSLFNDDQKFLLKEFMRLTDLVKFAEFLPDSETSIQIKKIAAELINSF